jgi:hypothetical protein
MTRNMQSPVTTRRGKVRATAAVCHAVSTSPLSAACADHDRICSPPCRHTCRRRALRAGQAARPRAGHDLHRGIAAERRAGKRCLFPDAGARTRVRTAVHHAPAGTRGNLQPARADRRPAGDPLPLLREPRPQRIPAAVPQQQGDDGDASGPPRACAERSGRDDLPHRARRSSGPGRKAGTGAFQSSPGRCSRHGTLVAGRNACRSDGRRTGQHRRQHPRRIQRQRRGDPCRDTRDRSAGLWLFRLPAAARHAGCVQSEALLRSKRASAHHRPVSRTQSVGGDAPRPGRQRDLRESGRRRPARDDRRTGR